MKAIQMPVNSMMLLPPRKDLCQICATKHEPELPHNQQSMYYQMQHQMKHNCAPSWADAMAHCTEEMRAMWIPLLKEKGVEIGEVTTGQVTDGN